MKDREKWLETFVESYMFRDVQVCLDGQTNIAAALILSVYTEIMGGLINGTLTDDNQAGPNYKTFLKRMNYPEDKLQPYYKAIRCGLVHQYFIKGEHTVSPYPVFKGPRGIHEQDSVLYFFSEVYFEEFKQAFQIYKGELASNEILQKAFDRALSGDTLPYAVKSAVDPSIPRDVWPPKGHVSGGVIIFPPQIGPHPFPVYEWQGKPSKSNEPKTEEEEKS